MVNRLGDKLQGLFLSSGDECLLGYLGPVCSLSSEHSFSVVKNHQVILTLSGGISGVSCTATGCFLSGVTMCIVRRWTHLPKLWRRTSTYKISKSTNFIYSPLVNILLYLLNMKGYWKQFQVLISGLFCLPWFTSVTVYLYTESDNNFHPPI